MALLRNRGPEGTRYTLRGDTFMLESPSGEELFTIQEKKLSIRDKMEIERSGKTVATIKKALVTPLRDRYGIEIHPDQDDALILACTVCIDQLSRVG